jgi:arsenite methyltransferase
LGEDLIAFVGCSAGAIPIEDYRRGLIQAGFAAVEVIDSGADLNAYAHVENQAGCCSPPAASSSGLAVVDAGCGSPAAGDAALHARLSDLLRRHDVNQYAASVRVYAVKPR